jgi:hypothetical protein
MSRKVAREAPALARAAKIKRSRAFSREPAAKPAASGAADALLAYSQKRDFAKTAEPKGRVQDSAGNRFCVQKHDATRLHSDLRLELDGVYHQSVSASLDCPGVLPEGRKGNPNCSRVASSNSATEHASSITCTSTGNPPAPVFRPAKIDCR